MEKLPAASEMTREASESDICANNDGASMAWGLGIDAGALEKVSSVGFESTSPIDTPRVDLDDS